MPTMSSSLLATSLIMIHVCELFLCIEHNPPALFPLPIFPKGPVSIQCFIHTNYHISVILCDEVMVVQLLTGFQFLLFVSHAATIEIVL